MLETHIARAYGYHARMGRSELLIINESILNAILVIGNFTNRPPTRMGVYILICLDTLSLFPDNRHKCQIRIRG